MTHNDFLEEWIDGTSICRQTSQTVPGFVWNIYDSCLQLFIKLVPLVPSIKSRASTVESFKEQLGRLLAWGDGFEGGKLDETLESAPELKRTILEFLAALGSILSGKLYMTLRPRGSNPATLEREAMQLRFHVENARNMVDEDEDLGSDSESDLSPRDSIHTIAAEVRFYINRLMDLLPSLERTTVHPNEAAERPAAGGVLFRVSEPARSYVLNIHDKFPNADHSLVERLGEANWQRHEWIRSRDNGTINNILVDAKTVFKPVSMFHDSGLGSSVPAHSSYEASIASHSSFKTSITEGQAGGHRVPSTPKEVFTGKPFVCEFCGHLLKKIRNRVEWKIHIFADLRPYTCTFPSCTEELRIFPTRKMWANHEFTKHCSSKQWTCYQCRLQFEFPTQWENHVKDVHGIAFSPAQRVSAIAMAETAKVQAIEIQKCPLCLKQGMKAQREFTTHVAKHMETIALATLPRDTDTDSEEDSIASNDTTLGLGREIKQSSSATKIEVAKNYDNKQDGLGLEFEDGECPLCVEEFDLSDLNFKPCPCGYRICQFCYNNIRNHMNGMCPACQTPYDEKNIEYKITTPEQIAAFKADAQKRSKKVAERQKEASKRESEIQNRKHLAGLRVVQKNLVYIAGLPDTEEQDLEQTLRDNKYFSQYGQITKLVTRRANTSESPTNPIGVYVTFARNEDAARCIAAVDGSKNGDGILRAQFGTTKYCSAYLRNEVCTNRQCLFLHEEPVTQD